MKILVDVCLSPLWAGFLAQRGFPAIHWTSVGRLSAPDTEILSYAEANGFVILTHDLDFGALLAATKTRGPSVIQVRAKDVLPAAMGETVVRGIRAARDQLQSGALVTIDPLRSRVRILPI